MPIHDRNFESNENFDLHSTDFQRVLRFGSGDLLVLHDESDPVLYFTQSDALYAVGERLETTEEMAINAPVIFVFDDPDSILVVVMCLMRLYNAMTRQVDGNVA